MKWLKFLKAAKKRALEGGAETGATDDGQQKHSKRRSMQQERKERTSIEQWHEARKSRTSIDICAALNVTTTERLSVCKAGITLLINRTYIVIKHLGSGSSGQVKLAFNLRSKKLVAIKAVRKGGSGGSGRDVRSYDGRGSHGSMGSRASGGGGGGGGGFLTGSRSVNVFAAAAAGGTAATGGGGSSGGERGWRSITPSSILRRSASSNVGSSAAGTTCRGSSTSPHRRFTGSSAACAATATGPAAGSCQTEEFVREIAILKRLSHPNIVQLVEVIDDPGSDCLLLVMGYVEGSTLQPQQLQPGRWQPLPEQVAWRYARDVLCGLEYLHCHGVVHGDLKPANFIQDSLTGVVRILDFGSAVLHGRVVGEEGLRGAHVPMGCTPGFRSPESLAAGYRPSFELDMWALGVCLYLWVFGELPFKGSAPFVVYENIRSAPLAIPTHPRISAQLTDLVTRLLDKDPATRLTVHDAVQHAWTIAQGLAPLRTTSPVVMAARLQLATAQHVTTTTTAGAAGSITNNTSSTDAADVSSSSFHAHHARRAQAQQAHRLFRGRAEENQFSVGARGAPILSAAAGAAMPPAERLQPHPSPARVTDVDAPVGLDVGVGAGAGAGGMLPPWLPRGEGEDLALAAGTGPAQQQQPGALRSQCSSSVNLALTAADWVGSESLADLPRRGCASPSEPGEPVGMAASEPWMVATASPFVPSCFMFPEPQPQPQPQRPSVAAAAAWQESCWQSQAPAVPAAAESEGPWRMAASSRPTCSSTGMTPHVPHQPFGTMPRITEGSVGNTGSLGGTMSAAMAAAMGSNGGGGGSNLGRRNSCEMWELRSSVTDDELQAAISSCCDPTGSAAVLMESIFTEVTFAAKHQIIQSGDPLDRIYLITAGEVEIYHDLMQDGPDAPCPHKPIIEGLSDPESELDDPGNFLNIRLPGSNVPQLERLSTGLLNITGGGTGGGSTHGAAHALSALAAAAIAGGSQSGGTAGGGSGLPVSSTGYLAPGSVLGMAATQAGVGPGPGQHPNSARNTLTGLIGPAGAAPCLPSPPPAVHGGGAAGKGSSGREPSSSSSISLGLFSRAATQTGHLIVAAKGPGDSLGFAGMLPGTGQPVWSANVRARTQVTAFTATVESLHKLAQAHPQVEPLLQQMAVQQETDIAVAEAMRSLRLVSGAARGAGPGCTAKHHHHYTHSNYHHNTPQQAHEQQAGSFAVGPSAAVAVGHTGAVLSPARPMAAGLPEAAAAARGRSNTAASSEGESESCGTGGSAATELTVGSGLSPAGSPPAQPLTAGCVWHASASTDKGAGAAAGAGVGCVGGAPNDGSVADGELEVEGHPAMDVMVG